MKLSEEDIQNILKILDEMDYGEIRLEIDDLKIHVQKKSCGGLPTAPRLTNRPTDAPADKVPSENAPSATQPVTSASVAAAPPEPVATHSRHLVKAPTSGVFYRAPAPGADPFVHVGQTVAPEDTLCLLEVMKLLMSVAAGIAGRVAEALVENGVSVTEGQALFVIELGSS